MLLCLPFSGSWRPPDRTASRGGGQASALSRRGSGGTPPPGPPWVPVCTGTTGGLDHRERPCYSGDVDSSFAAPASQSQIRPDALRFYSDVLRRRSRSCPEIGALSYEVGQLWNSLKQNCRETPCREAPSPQALWRRGRGGHLHPAPARERRKGRRDYRLRSPTHRRRGRPPSRERRSRDW